MGRVTKTGTDKRLPDIRVSLLDAAGRVIDSTITDSSGTFYVNARGAGTYRLRFAQRALWFDVTPSFELAKDDAHDGAYGLVEHSSDSIPTADQVDHVAVPVHGNPAPRFPSDLRARGKQGGALVRFVIDGAGQVVPNSAEVISATSPAFSNAVLDVLYRWHFEPATIHGAPAPELVCMPTTFQLTNFGGSAPSDSDLDSLIASWPQNPRCPKASFPARHPNER
jgi:TonB family protein